MSETYKNLLHVCACCLSRKSQLISLDNCKHASFLPSLLENWLNLKGRCVCRLCHSTIKRIYHFKRQVEDSCSKLNQIIDNLPVRNNSLGASKIEINSTVKGRPIEFEVKNLILDKSETKELVTVMKVEHDSDSELDSLVPLAQLEGRQKDDGKDKSETKELVTVMKVEHDSDSELDSLVPLAQLERRQKDDGKDADRSEIPDIETTMKVEPDSDLELNSATPLTQMERRKKETKKVAGELIEFEVKNLEAHHQDTQELETTLKVEHNSDSEIDSMPLAQLERRKKQSKKEKAKKNPKKGSKIEGTAAKYDGKIRMVTLTWAQMMEERSLESSKKSYLNLPFKCTTCIIAYDHEVTLKVHTEQKHLKREGGMECNICKSILSTERSYKEHSTRHFKRYECVACGKRNNNINPVIKHYNEQHGNITTNFTCAECGFNTDTYSRYKYHRNTHKAKVECKDCGSTFAHPSGLRAHMLTVHCLSERAFACATCGKRFRAKSSLASHRARHAAAAAFPLAFCAPCGVHYATPTGLRHHLKTHSRHVTESDKRFICDECGSKFSTKWSLEEHIDWVHLMKVKHECVICGKGFKNNAAMKKHMNYVHEKKRPPRNKMCDHCGRGFTTMSILRSHVRTHTGERPLACAHCNATFAHPAALYTHTKLLHAKT